MDIKLLRVRGRWEMFPGDLLYHHLNNWHLPSHFTPSPALIILSRLLIA
jgi:hypothetical protein